MKEIETVVSTGNVRGLDRSTDEIRNSLEIVSSEHASSSYVFDSLAFLVKDGAAVQEYLSLDGRTCIGTTTLGCFEDGNRILGGLLVSTPVLEDGDAERYEQAYTWLAREYGERLANTVASYPGIVEDIETVSSEDVGLSEMNINLLNETAEAISVTSGESEEVLYTFGFIKDGTLNVLYLVSSSADVRDVRSVVRQIDTLTVFENPASYSEVTGSVWVPCKRVLSTPRFQSYVESSFMLSQPRVMAVGEFMEPEIFVDSVLTFSFSQQLSSDVSVQVIGSRNASQIEHRLRKTLETTSDVKTDKYTVFKDGVVGEVQGQNKYSFVGQSYVDWACECGADCCPTTILVSSSGNLGEQDLSEVDEILQEVDGREPFEVEIEGLVLEDVTLV